MVLVLERSASRTRHFIRRPDSEELIPFSRRQIRLRNFGRFAERRTVINRRSASTTQVLKPSDAPTARAAEVAHAHQRGIIRTFG